MKVMLDVFSGRTNPVWTVPSAVTRRVMQLMARQGGPRAVAPTPKLGFRGLHLQAGPEDAADWSPEIPPSFVVASPPTAAEHPAYRGLKTAQLAAAAPLEDVEVEAAQTLLETARPVVETPVIDTVAQELGGGRPEVQAAERQPRAVQPRAVAPEPDIQAPCEPLLSTYRPWFWNAPAIRLRNNCYNYATNFVSNFVAQPGRFSGQIYQAFSCEEVGRAAAADGIETQCHGESRIVALVIWPGHDFHWYRKHEDFWAHKLGIFAARNVDNIGRVITGALNPVTCDRGPYSQFCTYLFVPPDVRVL